MAVPYPLTSLMRDMYEVPGHLIPNIDLIFDKEKDILEKADFGHIRLGQKINFYEFLFSSRPDQENIVFQQIQYSWKYILEQVGKIISFLSLKNPGKYIVSKTSATIYELQDYSSGGKTLSLAVDLEAFLAETQKIVIPEIVYDDSPEGKIIEWKCGACKTPNPIENRSCDACGSPRSLLVQEIMHNVDLGRLSEAY